MGNHPTAVIAYQFKDVNPQTLYNDFFNATKARNYRLENKDDQRLHLTVEWESQMCGYHDVIDIQVQAMQGGAEAVLTSRSSSVCPGCCCGCCKQLFCWYTCYCDSQQNQLHCRELVLQVHRPYTAAILGRHGGATVLARWL